MLAMVPTTFVLFFGCEGLNILLHVLELSSKQMTVKTWFSAEASVVYRKGYSGMARNSASNAESNTGKAHGK